MPLPLLLIPLAAAASTATGVSVGTLVGAIIGSIVGGASVAGGAVAAFFHFKKRDPAALAHQESLARQKTLYENRNNAVASSLNKAQSAARTAAKEVHETSESFLSATRSFSEEARALDDSGAALQSSIELASRATSQTQAQSESWNQMQAQLRASRESMNSVADVLSDTQDSLGSNEQDIQRLNDALASQAQVVATLTETIRTLTEASNRSDAEKAQLLERNEALEQEGMSLEQESISHMSQIDALQSTLAQAVEKYKRLKARHLEVVSQNVALQQELSQKQEEIDALISAHASPLTALGLHRRAPESGNQGAPDAAQAPRNAH